MNKFYIEKIQNIRSSLPVSNEDPLQKLKGMMRFRNSTFSIHPAHPDLVDTILSNIRNSKACGLDEIDTYVMKLIKPFVVPAVTHKINLSIGTSTFPEKWKY